ncbi:MAG: hypothetical protein K0T99_01995 [Alphaproteobacteria bacterium]|nr:hypothetical protein [Alphaproteobacteria bacterium]
MSEDDQVKRNEGFEDFLENIKVDKSTQKLTGEDLSAISDNEGDLS